MARAAPRSLLKSSTLAKAPVFSPWDIALGRGSVGGSGMDYSSLGQQAGVAALDYLKGNKPAGASPSVLPSHFVGNFDWAQIQKWGGEADRLPKDSVFINRPKGLWEQYRYTVILTLLVLFLQLLLIAALLVERRQRSLAQQSLRESEKALRASEEKFRFITENMTDFVTMVDGQGNLVYRSPSSVKFFDQGSEYDTDASVFKNIHPDDRERVMEGFREGLLAGKDRDMEFRYGHADGHYSWIHIRGHFLLDESGACTGGSPMTSTTSSWSSSGVRKWP